MTTDIVPISPEFSRELARLKPDFIAKYGRKAWDKLLKAVERYRTEEKLNPMFIVQLESVGYVRQKKR